MVWHRLTATGYVLFRYEPDDRGQVSLTEEEMAGLMRTGRWNPGPPPSRGDLG